MRMRPRGPATRQNHSGVSGSGSWSSSRPGRALGPADGSGSPGDADALSGAGLAASVIMTLRGEPPARVAAAVAAVSRQTGLPGRLEVVIALPPAETDLVAGVRPTGSVATVRTVPNPMGGRSAGLNRAARAAASDFVVRVDARSRIGPDYVARCLARLVTDPTVGVVGGHQQPIATGAGSVAVGTTGVEGAREGGPGGAGAAGSGGAGVAGSGGARVAGIARALGNPWLLGGAAYRRLHASGRVDTAYLGAFRREQLLGIGGYDERLEANEDFDLCQRYRNAGLTVWLEEGLVVGYEPRAELVSLWRQHFVFGRSKVRFWRLTGGRPNRRQALAMALPPVVSATVVGGVGMAPRPGHSAALLLLTAALGAAGVTSRTETVAVPVAVRAWSVVASVVILAAWLIGVATEALHGSNLLRYGSSGRRRDPTSVGTGPL